MTAPAPRILGIIPARAGSKRVPKKNIRPLGGVPLVERSIRTALASPALAAVVVSSDDAEVLAIAAKYPRVVALARPPALATDTAPAIAYVHHALDVLERERGMQRFDATCILQPSSPLTTPDDVESTIATFMQSDCDSAVSVMKLDHAIHPVKLKRLQGDKLLPFLEEEKGRMAAHELPELYVRNCAVYVSRRRTIDAGDVIGVDSRGWVMPRERSVDINDEIDFAFCEFLFARGSA